MVCQHALYSHRAGCSGGLGQLREMISSHGKLKGFQGGEARGLDGQKMREKESGLASGYSARPGALCLGRDPGVVRLRAAAPWQKSVSFSDPKKVLLPHCSLSSGCL